MKIVCIGCGAEIGEQEPFDNHSEVKAKCNLCLDKENEEASRFQPMPKSGEKLEIALKNGLKGVVWLVEDNTGRLSLWEMVVSGRKFFCSNDNKEAFREYIISLKDDEPEVTFLYSLSLKLDPPAARGHKKAKGCPEPTQGSDPAINYNCTARLPKHHVLHMFGEKAERMNKCLDVIAESTYKAYKEECMLKCRKS